MCTNDSSSGRKRKISLPMCLLSNKQSWRDVSSLGTRQNTTAEHTHLRTLRIVRFFINISDFFPLADKGGILLWRNTPFLLLPGFTFVFFQVRRTVSWDTESTISHSTILSARI